MEVFIRQVATEDATEIAGLSAQLGYPVSEMQTLQNIKAIRQHRDHEAFVAVHEDHVIGWIGVSYTIQLESPPSVEIRGLVVDEKYRKSGIGKMLVEKAKQWGRNKGNNLLRLRCNVKRTETHAFYLQLGFAEAKQQKVFEIKL